MQNFDCIIVGSGPAGICAAIYLKRANKNVLLLEKNIPGGQVTKTSVIDNYPGFIHIDGASLANNMIHQLKTLGIEITYGNVQKIENHNSEYNVITDNNKYTTKKIILALGRTPRLLGIKNEEKYLGKGISYCATCDGSLYKNKIVAVVGGGNSAFEDAMYLSKICKHVLLINRSDNFRAEQALQIDVKNIDNIDVITNVNVTNLIENNNKIKGIKLDNNDTYEIDGLFICIGQIPPKFMVDNLLTNNGYILVNNKMQTNLSGIYACGDIIKKDFYQISIAVGEGTIAALNVIKELKN